MNLAKALKTKNYLAGELARLNALLYRENSRRADSSSKTERGDLCVKIAQVRNALIILKTKIAQANSPIWEELFRLAELKGEIEFLKTLPTKDGKCEEIIGMGQREPKTVEYTAHWTQDVVDKEIADLQIEIEERQDKVDVFNATTNV